MYRYEYSIFVTLFDLLKLDWQFQLKQDEIEVSNFLIYFLLILIVILIN